MAEETEQAQQPEHELLTVNIGNVNDGAAVDAFDLELRKIMQNIADLSTSPTATRSITLKFDFKPHGDRCKVEIEFQATSKLAPIETHKSQMYVGRTKEGALIAFDTDPRQMPLWEAPKPKEVPVVQFTRGDGVGK